MNSGSTPPGGEGRDPPRPRTSFASSLFSRRGRPFRAVGSAAGCATRGPAQSFPVDGKPACGPLRSAAGRALIRPQPTGRGGYAPSGRRRAATSTCAGCGCGWASPAQVRADGCPSGLDQRDSLGHAAAWAGRRQRQVRCGCVERNRDERRGQARFGYPAANSRRARSALSRPRPGVRFPAPARRPPRPQPGWCLTRESPSRRYPVGPSMDLAPR